MAQSYDSIFGDSLDKGTTQERLGGTRITDETANDDSARNRVNLSHLSHEVYNEYDESEYHEASLDATFPLTKEKLSETPDLLLRIGTPIAAELHVSSRILAQGSVVFRKMLFGCWRERKPETGDWIVDLPDDDPETMVAIVARMHLHYPKPPKSEVNIKFLSKIATIVDKYYLWPALFPWFGEWNKILDYNVRKTDGHNTAPGSGNINNGRIRIEQGRCNSDVLWIGWVFGREDIVEAALEHRIKRIQYDESIGDWLLCGKPLSEDSCTLLDLDEKICEQRLDLQSAILCPESDRYTFVASRVRKPGEESFDSDRLRRDDSGQNAGLIPRTVWFNSEDVAKSPFRFTLTCLSKIVTTRLEKELPDIVGDGPGTSICIQRVGRQPGQVLANIPSLLTHTQISELRRRRNLWEHGLHELVDI